MKIIFMGTPEFACVVFEQLCEKYEIVAVCTQPDKPVGRKQIVTPPPMKLAALARGIPVLQPQKLDSSVSEKLAQLGAEAIIVVAYGKILPESILHIAPCINVHASILPAYRGASPIQQMILSDDEEFGVSIMRMDSGLDSGDILGVARIPRSSHAAHATTAMLGQMLAQLGAHKLIEVLENLDTITPIPQDHTKATYCKKICKNDGLVCFDNAKNIYKKWLAFSQWPGVFLASGIKLFGIRVVPESNPKSSATCPTTSTSARAGEILSVKPCVIACEEGALQIDELQAPSRNRMDASAFLLSQQKRVGDVLC